MAEQDRIAELIDQLAGLSDDEQTRMIEGLSPEDREAVAALAGQKAAHHQERGEADIDMAESFRWAADADPLELLDQGNALLLDACDQVAQPAGFLVALDRLTKDDPRALVAGVFAAVVLQTSDRELAPALRELRDEWYAMVQKERGGGVDG